MWTRLIGYGIPNAFVGFFFSFFAPCQINPSEKCVLIAKSCAVAIEVETPYQKSTVAALAGIDQSFLVVDLSTKNLG